MRAFWLPVIAAPLAVLVGVGGFLLASPLAPTVEVAPDVIEGWTLSPASELLPLVEPTDPPDGVDASAEGVGVGPVLPSTLIPVVDPTTEASVRLLLTDRLAMVDSLDSVDGVLPEGSALGLTVLDPCADAEEGSADCPSGARGTVLASTSPPPLVVSATTSRASCSSLVVGSGRAGIAITTTRPVAITATVTIGDVSRIEEIASTGADREAWLASGVAGAWSPIVHCLQLNDLPPGESGNVRVVAVDDTWEVAITSVSVDVEGGSEIPPSFVQTIGKSGVVISVPALSTTTVRFSAFVVPSDVQPAACSFEGNPEQLEPLVVNRDRFTPEQMEARGYEPTFSDRHTAAFVVPEASTVTVCAGSFGPGRDGPIADSVFGEVLRTPDLVVPVITLDGYGLTIRTGYDDLRLEGSVGGTEASCGVLDLSFDAIGSTLCDYTRSPATSLGWDAELLVSATATAFGSTGTRSYDLPIAPQICGFGCRVPDDQVFDVPLHARADLCIGGGCPQSLVGTARLRVTWVDGDASGATEWINEGAADPIPRDPVLVKSSPVSIGPLDPATETQTASFTVTTDRETTMQLNVEDMTLGIEGRGADRVITDAEFTDSRTVTVDSVLAGSRQYVLTAVFTDREGNSSAYSINTELGRAWSNGYFVTDPIPVSLDADLTVRRADGQPIGAGNYVVSVGGYIATHQPVIWRSPENPAVCAPDELRLDPGAAAQEGGIGATVPYYIGVVVFEPSSPVTEAGDCSATQQIYQWWWSDPVRELEITGLLNLDQVRAGVTITDTEVRGGVEYEIELRISPQA